MTIPVKLYTATEQKDVRFRLVHAKDGAPIEEKRFCTAEDKEVQWDELAREYEVSKGEFVIVAPEEIEQAAPETTRTIEIGDFIELEEIDPIYFEKSYFLEPADAGAKPFNLLRRALQETGRVAVARVAIRTKERLATLRVYDETLVVETMYWPDEIRSPGDPRAARRPGHVAGAEGSRDCAFAGREPVFSLRRRAIQASLPHRAAGADRSQDVGREASRPAAQAGAQGRRPDGAGGQPGGGA